MLRACYLNSQEDTVDVWEDGVHQVEPSDDESIPAEGQEKALGLPANFPFPCPALTLASPFSQ